MLKVLVFFKARFETFLELLVYLFRAHVFIFYIVYHCWFKIVVDFFLTNFINNILIEYAVRKFLIVIFLELLTLYHLIFSPLFVEYSKELFDLNILFWWSLQFLTTCVKHLYTVNQHVASLLVWNWIIVI